MLVSLRRPAVAGLAAVVATLAVAAGGAGAAGSLVAYNLYPLVSDTTAVSAPLVDTSLVNGWGLSASATSPWWTSNNKTNTSTLYSGVGGEERPDRHGRRRPDRHRRQRQHRRVPRRQGQRDDRVGTVPLRDTRPARSSAGRRAVDSANAVVAADNSAAGAEYEGLALLNDRLYAADFHNGRVDVFDAEFKPVTLTKGFNDPKIPKGWAPFGIQALDGNVFVTYAQRDKAGKDAVRGGGLGFVDEYSPDGVLVARVASQGGPRAPLDAPWGLALAPSSFGAYSGDLLVGNFGNGRISAYQHRADGKWVYKVPDPGPRAASRSSSTASGRSRSGTAPPPGRPTTSTSSPGRPARRTASTASSPSASATGKLPPPPGSTAGAAAPTRS